MICTRFSKRYPFEPQIKELKPYTKKDCQSQALCWYFANSMVRKDTIEDKIMQLQEKKRMLAKELISDDATFVKALTREDVEYLFS